MTFKRILGFVLSLPIVGLNSTPPPSLALPERLGTALKQCLKWIKLSAEKPLFIWDLPNKKNPFLLQMESTCYPGLLETRPIEMVKAWIPRAESVYGFFLEVGQISKDWMVKARPLKKVQFWSRSRKAIISTTGIYGIFRGLKFEPDTEVEQKGGFFKGLKAGLTAAQSLASNRTDVGRQQNPTGWKQTSWQAEPPRNRKKCIENISD